MTLSEVQKSNWFWSQGDPVTISNSAAATSILSTGIGSRSIPANFWSVGRQVQLRISGVYNTKTLLPGNITIAIKLGSTTIATGTITNLLVGASSVGYAGVFSMRCAATGSGGSVYIDG